MRLILKERAEKKGDPPKSITLLIDNYQIVAGIAGDDWDYIEVHLRDTGIIARKKGWKMTCEKCAYWQWTYISGTGWDQTFVILPTYEQRCTYPPCRCKEEKRWKMTDLTFGRCTRCNEHVSGHAVYVDGVLYCSLCELDKRYQKLEDVTKGIDTIRWIYLLPAQNVNGLYYPSSTYPRTEKRCICSVHDARKKFTCQPKRRRVTRF